MKLPLRAARVALPLAFFALASFAMACSSSSSDPTPETETDHEDSGGPQDATPGPVKCSDETSVLEIENPTYPAKSGGTMLPAYRVAGVFDTLDAAKGLSILAARADETSTRVAILEKEGQERVLAEAKYADGLVSTVSPDGKRCAAFYGGDTLRFVCEGAEPEDTGLKISVSSGAGTFLPVWKENGSLSIYGQAYAAITEAVRGTDGKWREYDWQRSSISYATSFVEHAKGNALCWIASGSLPTVVIGDATVRSASPSDHCALAATSAGVHVVLDEGVATIPWSPSAATFDVQPLELPARPSAVISVGDKAWALVVSDDSASKNAANVRAYALDGSGPVDIATGLATSPSVFFDASTKRLHVISTKSDRPAGSSVKQTLTVTSRCAETLLQ